MSYEDTNCPCGDKKPNDTLLCDTCLQAFAARPEMAIYNDGGETIMARRHALIILVTLARGRKRNAARKAVAHA
jgi:hypothetical protein